MSMCYKKQIRLLSAILNSYITLSISATKLQYRYINIISRIYPGNVKQWQTSNYFLCPKVVAFSFYPLYTFLDKHRSGFISRLTQLRLTTEHQKRSLLPLCISHCWTLTLDTDEGLLYTSNSIHCFYSYSCTFIPLSYLASVSFLQCIHCFLFSWYFPVTFTV